MNAKRCTRCDTIKTTAAFRPNPNMRDGHDSWCKQCCRDATKAWRHQNPHYTKAASQTKKTYGDPIEYSRRHCLHIADYLDRAIARYESATGNEAPPYLTEMRNLARKMASDHPPGRQLGIQATCRHCADSFESFNRLTLYCSTRCKDQHSYQNTKQRQPIP